MKRDRDFEGRCVKCRRVLELEVRILDQRNLKLTVVPCERHPGESYILWPQRGDIKRVAGRG